MNNLWPEDIATDYPLKGPVSILREQAAKLGERTKNLVKAEVDRGYSKFFTDKFNYHFYLVAPALENYRYRLFSIVYPAEQYPVGFVVDRDIQRELKPGTVKNHDKEIQAKDESEFLETLRKIFGSRKTRQVIAAILDQIGGENESASA